MGGKILFVKDRKKADRENTELISYIPFYARRTKVWDAEMVPYRPFFRRSFFNAGPFNAGPISADFENEANAY